MTAAICLQGGAEFTQPCLAMDAELVRRAPGRVVVTALAGAVGSDYRTATANGVRHFRDAGAVDVVAAPDARADPDGASAALSEARLVVLPGGSPGRLRAALLETPVGSLIRELSAGGVMVMGSSAGAMLLCEWTVLPEGGPRVASGLGCVPNALVLPHWTGRRAAWLGAVVSDFPAGADLLGIPECSGVLVEEGRLTGIGMAATSVLDRDGSGLRSVGPGDEWDRRRDR